MNLKNLMPKPKNLIPGYYLVKGQNEKSEENKPGYITFPKSMVSLIYGYAAFGLLATPLIFYGVRANLTGKFNPLKQKEAVIELRTEQRLEQETYDKSFKKLFGPNGYADRNQDNIIDFKERVDAYRRMGFFQDVLPIAGETEFPKPTLNQLEKAVESYEGGKK